MTAGGGLGAAETGTGGTCPAGHAPLAGEFRAEPWCPVCEWNLDAYDRLRITPRFGWLPADRLLHRLAYRLNRRQYAALAGRPPGRSGPALARTVLTGVSVLLWLCVLACLVFGGYLTVAGFGSLRMLLGLLLIAIAVLARPRFGRLRREAWTVDRATAPALFELISSVASAIGAREPHVVLLVPALNAFTTTVGIRRRRLLGLGLPLLAALPAQERVALVGHELGHFVNGDLRRGLLTQPAYEMLGRLANQLRPHRVLASIGGLISLILAGTLGTILWAGQVILICIGQRDCQRAEYLADDISARVAGSTAAIGLLESLLVMEPTTKLIRTSQHNHGRAQTWRDAVAYNRRAFQTRMAVLGQQSQREQASLFTSHPPAGLRLSMLRSRPEQEPDVVLTDEQNQRIDDELAPWYHRLTAMIAVDG